MLLISYHWPKGLADPHVDDPRVATGVLKVVGHHLDGALLEVNPRDGPGES